MDIIRRVVLRSAGGGAALAAAAADGFKPRCKLCPVSFHFWHGSKSCRNSKEEYLHG